jgi:hypothetical protein
MHGINSAQMASGAGNFRNPACEIGSVARCAGIRIRFCRRHMTGRQPVSGMLLAVRAELGLSVRIAAPGRT